MLSLLRKYRFYALLLLVLVGFSIRFLWLDQAPKGLLIDEAHYGYIAHSLNETGRDEHGVNFPLVFKGFGDYKLPIQAYLLMPIVKALGLNAVAVRLPSVLAGTLLILAIYWLLREMKISPELSLFGSLVVTLSPWTFILSRFAYEANLALLFFTLALASFLKINREQGWWWGSLAGLLMASTWYAYVAFRPVTILISVFFILIQLFMKKIDWRGMVSFWLVFLLGIAPLFQPKVLQAGVARFNQVGLLSDSGLVMQIDQNRTFCTMQLPKEWCYIWWNKPTIYTGELIKRFYEVYSPNFLFVEGDTTLTYQSLAGYGQFYLWLLPLFFLGVVSLAFQAGSVELNHSARALVLLGLLMAPISSMLAGEAQLVRLSPLVPFLIVVLVMGLRLLWNFMPPRPWESVLLGVVGVYLVIASAAFLTDFYTIHTIKNDLVYQSYLPELFDYLAEKDDAIIFIKPFFSDPIMAYAYYQQIDPAHYQENVELGKLEGSGFQHAVALDNYVVSEDPMINLGCQAVEAGVQAYYVTNEFFERPLIPYEYRVASTNGAVYYAYVYDASGYAQSQSKLCVE